MKADTLQFATEETAHARVNQLQAQLGIPLTAAAETINEAWDQIEALESKLTQGTATATAPQPTPTKPAPVTVPSNQPKARNVSAHYVGGLARSIAARTGEQAPAPTTNETELTGIARAAAANAKLQASRR